MLDYVRSFLNVKGDQYVDSGSWFQEGIESGSATRVPEIHRKRLGWIYI